MEAPNGSFGGPILNSKAKYSGIDLTLNLPTSRFLLKRLCRKGFEDGRSVAETSRRPPVHPPLGVQTGGRREVSREV